jgi:hypothetical protein
VTAPRLPERDAGQVDALVADRYLDALLAAAERHVHDAPADLALDPELRAAARVLQRSLVRVHPSFRFEERLAARLAHLAATGVGRTADGGADVIPFPVLAATARTSDPLLAAILAGDLDPTDEVALDRAAPGLIERRPLLVGGAAITSALSLVGVALVAWRATRPGPRGSAATALSGEPA